MSPCADSLPFFASAFAQLKVIHDDIGVPEEITKCTHAWATAFTGIFYAPKWDRFLVTSSKAQLLMIPIAVITVENSTDQDQTHGNDSISNGGGSLEEDTKCFNPSKSAAEFSAILLNRDRYNIRPESNRRNTTPIYFKERRMSLCLSYSTTQESPWLKAFVLTDSGDIVSDEFEKRLMKNIKQRYHDDSIKPCDEMPAFSHAQDIIYSAVCWQDRQYYCAYDKLRVRQPSFQKYGVIIG